MTDKQRAQTDRADIQTQTRWVRASLCFRTAGRGSRSNIGRRLACTNYKYATGTAAAATANRQTLFPRIASYQEQKKDKIDDCLI